MQKLSPQARQMLAKKLAMIQAARSAPAPSVPRPAMPPGAGGPPQMPPPGMKTGGAVKRYAEGGDVAEYDERISKERDKVDRNNKLVNPYLREDANAANKRIETNVSDLRKKRQEAAGVGAGRGEKNPPKAFAKGGFVRAADGCAQRGKTRGKMC